MSKKKKKPILEEKRKLKEEKRLKKLQTQKVYIKTLIVLLTLTIGVGLVFIYKGANNDGISWEEVEQRQKEAEVIEGHLGVETKLITEKYEAEIDKEDFAKKKENEDTFYVYYYSPYCPFCEDLGDEIIDFFGDVEEDFVVLDVNRDVELQDVENVMSVPSVGVYENGEQVEIRSGITKEVLEEMVGSDVDGDTED